MSDKNEKHIKSADRDRTSEELAKEVPPEQSDDLFTDRGAVEVSSPHDGYNGDNKVPTSLDGE